ncbi:hypothetical protein N9W84_01540 [bacterium]|nr:hypothetical protein [bacterium]
MGIKFFQTIMGRKFYEGTLPHLIRQLERLNDNLEKINKSSEDKKE